MTAPTLPRHIAEISGRGCPAISAVTQEQAENAYIVARYFADGGSSYSVVGNEVDNNTVFMGVSFDPAGGVIVTSGDLNISVGNYGDANTSKDILRIREDNAIKNVPHFMNVLSWVNPDNLITEFSRGASEENIKRTPEEMHKNAQGFLQETIEAKNLIKTNVKGIVAKGTGPDLTQPGQKPTLG